MKKNFNYSIAVKLFSTGTIFINYFTHVSLYFILDKV